MNYGIGMGYSHLQVYAGETMISGRVDANNETSFNRSQ